MDYKIAYLLSCQNITFIHRFPSCRALQRNFCGKCKQATILLPFRCDISPNPQIAAKLRQVSISRHGDNLHRDRRSLHLQFLVRVRAQQKLH